MEYYRVVLYALTYGCLSEFYLGMNEGDGLEHCGMFVFAIYIFSSISEVEGHKDEKPTKTQWLQLNLKKNDTYQKSSN